MVRDEYQQQLTVILPARNEAHNLVGLLPRLRAELPDANILVIDDGSTDDTRTICHQNGVTCISHSYAKGNGAAIKTGARTASSNILLFMDADGQHDPADIPRLLAKLTESNDMVVGARSFSSQASFSRGIANGFYNRLATWMVGHRVTDLTSGFRAVDARRFKEFLHLLPNGFSYPTTITMAFFRAGYTVAYLPIEAAKRLGKSHISVSRDGLRFLLIIFKIGTLYSPMRIFAPIASLFFILGSGLYAYTFYTSGRFTNMSALLFITAVLVFLIGLVSEQITTLIYKDKE